MLDAGSTEPGWIWLTALATSLSNAPIHAAAVIASVGVLADQHHDEHGRGIAPQDEAQRAEDDLSLHDALAELEALLQRLLDVPRVEDRSDVLQQRVGVRDLQGEHHRERRAGPQRSELAADVREELPGIASPDFRELGALAQLIRQRLPFAFEDRSCFFASAVSNFGSVVCCLRASARREKSSTDLAGTGADPASAVVPAVVEPPPPLA
jgi:hypothetical protein